MKTRRLLAVLCSIALLWAGGCSNPEKTKQRLLESGDRYMKEQKLSEAMLEYARALQIDPKFSAAYQRLGDVHIARGDRLQAWQNYERAANLAPDDLDLQIRAGGVLLLAQRYPDARRLAEVVLAKEPNNARALVLRANAVAGLEDLDTAISQIQQALQLEPNQSELYTNLASLEATSGQLDDAEATFKKAIEVAPQSAIAQLGLANFYWATGRGRQAEPLFRKAIEVEPQNPMAHRALAMFLLGSGQALAAEAPMRFVVDHYGDTDLRLVLADYYILTNRRELGLKEIDAAMKQPGGYAPARTRLAVLAYAEGRRKEAHEIVDEVIARNQGAAPALLAKARFVLAEGDHAAALSFATKATDLDDTYVQAWYLKGQLHAEEGDYFQAGESFRAVLKQNVYAAPAAIQLARSLYADGAVDTSGDYMDRLLRRVPDDQKTRLSLVRALLERREFGRAGVQLDELVQQYPKSPPVQMLKGALAMLQRDYATARRWYELSYRGDPTSVDTLSGLVGLDLAANRKDEALARVQRELKKTPRRTALLILLAQTYGAAGDAAKAEATLRDTLSIDPTAFPAYGMLGQLLYQQNRLEDGKTQFEQLIVRQPRNIAAHTMVGSILRRQNRTSEAIEWYKKALAIDPNAAVAANNLAWIYAEQGQEYDEAIMLARVAKKKLPDLAEVSDTIGWVYYRAGQPNMLKLAIPYLEEARNKDPRNPLYRYHLGAAYAKFGKTAEARIELQEALKISKDFFGSAETQRILSTLP